MYYIFYSKGTLAYQIYSTCTTYYLPLYIIYLTRTMDRRRPNTNYYLLFQLKNDPVYI
jgi:hypothetical protein